MKHYGKRLALAILAILAVFLLTACSGSEQPKQQASIEDISIKTAPQTVYTVGEAFTVQDGVIALNYDDGTTKDLAFTAEGVKVSSPDMAVPGTKTVTVEYDGFTASYMITVETKKYTISLNLNYDGAPAIASWVGTLTWLPRRSLISPPVSRLTPLPTPPGRVCIP